MNGPQSILRRVLVISSLAGWALGAAEPEAPPLPPSPVQQFREWLSLPRPQREQAVAEWPEEKRKVLLQKLESYEGLAPSERERRLGILELRWHLRPLMGLDPALRTASLSLVPPSLQPVVQERLRHWDSLAPADRARILEDDRTRELVTRFYLEVQQGRSREEIWTALDPARRAELEQALKAWTALSPSARGRTAAQLTAFFELPPGRQARALDELSESERQEMQKTLDAFARLSPEQRRLCVESFQKFALMPPPERASFLRNAARWQAMTPEDRAAWKDLVAKLPPLPPASPPEPPRPEPGPNRSQVAGTNLPGAR